MPFAWVCDRPLSALSVPGLEYFVHTENPDSEKCKWWYWKDDYFIPLRVEQGVWIVRHSQRNAKDAER